MVNTEMPRIIDITEQKIIHMPYKLFWDSWFPITQWNKVSMFELVCVHLWKQNFKKPLKLGSSFVYQCASDLEFINWVTCGQALKGSLRTCPLNTKSDDEVEQFMSSFYFLTVLRIQCRKVQEIWESFLSALKPVLCWCWRGKGRHSVGCTVHK